MHTNEPIMEEDFSPLDIHFARLMERLSGKTSFELFSAAALVSMATRKGDVCLDLSSVAGRARPHDSGNYPDLNAWTSALLKFAVVGRPGDYAPLILDPAGRLYLFRYWEYERHLCEALPTMARRTRASPAAHLGQRLREVFPTANESATDLQKAAAFMALTRSLCIISGGPGTGKTRTIAWILALVLELSYPSVPRVALAAPTGKAAARLQESIHSMVSSKAAALCFSPHILNAVPKEASTIHRLLGSRRGSSHFLHNKENPLPFDLVVVDEASMVDLALMAKLLQALPSNAGMILLGDRNQLASVESGAVLGDICFGMGIKGFSGGFAEEYEKTMGEVFTDPYGPSLRPASPSSLRDSMIELRRNYRFSPTSPIAVLSDKVKAGRSREVLDILKQADPCMLAWRPLPSIKEMKEALRPTVLDCWSEYLRSADPSEMLARFDKLRILCAVRKGPYGVEEANRLVEEILREEGLIRSSACWYRGRPVMVSGNDYALRLFNGDVGITATDEAGMIKVYFQGTEASPRVFSPSRIPPHETVFATTVHKSQGSEFDQVIVILPDRDTPILTRELLYTGITRATRRIAIWAEEEIIRLTVSRRIERASGLRDSLWANGLPVGQRDISQ